MSDRPTREGFTAVLERIRRGEAGTDDLLPAVYDELRALAAGLLRGGPPGRTLQPTALVHEAYLRLAEGTASWESRRHFLCVAAKAMRQIIINDAERRRAAKRGGGGWQRVTLAAVDDGERAADVDLPALDEALRKLEALDPRQCRIVELRFFAGLSVEETAEVLDVSPRTVKLDWRMARAWLHDQLADGERP